MTPSSYTLSRRDFLRAGLSATVLPTAFACKESAGPPVPPELTARPGAPTAFPVLATLTSLSLGGARDGFYYVPASYDPDVGLPLMVPLHGAGGEATNWTNWITRAEAQGFAMLVPDSRGQTWDAVRSTYGPDVTFLNNALEYFFALCRVQPNRIAFAGFSDGASYALSLGVPNGDLFRHILAFSPGYYDRGAPPQGLPQVFVSHGNSDGVLSFAITEDEIVPSLRDDGLNVTFRPFAGGHTVPAVVAEEALGWWLG
ncbi:MAG: hypothetical protein WD934_03260 [Gemmatimonadales bacterium]